MLRTKSEQKSEVTDGATKRQRPADVSQPRNWLTRCIESRKLEFVRIHDQPNTWASAASISQVISSLEIGVRAAWSAAIRFQSNTLMACANYKSAHDNEFRMGLHSPSVAMGFLSPECRVALPAAKMRYDPIRPMTSFTACISQLLHSS